MRRPAMLLFVACVISVSVRAEPTRVPQWLMNEPMSLFDWGLYQTEKKQDSFKTLSHIFTIRYVGGSAAYDWDADRIRLRFSFQGEGTSEECSENLKRAKTAMLDFPSGDS